MKICITTPFAFKYYCFKEYQECVEGIIDDMRLDADFSFVVYDNGNDPEFSEELKTWAESLHINIIYYVDPTQHHTIEHTNDYGKCSDRCLQIYKIIFETLVPEDTDLVFNIEDDTTFPADSLRKLVDVLKEYPEVITASGVNYNRRLGNLPIGKPMLWNFDFTFKGNEIIDVISRKIMPEKNEGLEFCDAGGLGCWLTRYPVLREMGWKSYHPLIGGGDLNWGAGLKLRFGTGRFVIDHSIKTKHWYLLNGIKGYTSVDNKGEEVFAEKPKPKILFPRGVSRVNLQLK